MWGGFDDWQGVLEEISYDALSISVWITKRIKILDGRKQLAV